jgi:hypothetical protein
MTRRFRITLANWQLPDFRWLHRHAKRVEKPGLIAGSRLMSEKRLVRSINREIKFQWLLLSMLLLFFLITLFEQLEIEAIARLTGVSLTVMVMVAVWTVKHKYLFLYSRIGIMALLLAVVALELVFDHYQLALLQLLILLGFFTLTTYYASREVLLSGPVDLNRIIGSICVYMFLAIVWALAYLLVEHFFPGSIPGIRAEDWRDAMQNSLYYSFVTITTLGFGDISPLQPMARYMSYLEAVIGQFYIAILVASLVGTSLAGGDAERRG